jgi:signal transduction histidine kinase
LGALLLLGGLGIGLLWSLYRSALLPVQSFKRWIAESSGDKAEAAFLAIDPEVREAVLGVRRMAQVLRKLEDDLGVLSREAEIGRLSDRVARDLNPQLQAVSAQIDLLLDRTSFQDPQRAALDKMSATAKKCARMLEGLLAFSGSAEYQFEPVPLEEALAAAIFMREGELARAGIRIERDEVQNAWVWASRKHLEFALGVLLRFKTGLLPEGGTLRTEVAAVPGQEAGAPPLTGRKISVSLIDSGPGFAPEDLAKLSGPLSAFESEHPERLVLAAVYGVAERHGGTLEIRSEGQGLGSTLILTLPEALPPSQTPPAA